MSQTENKRKQEKKKGDKKETAEGSSDTLT